jgi:hypothetical protein
MASQDDLLTAHKNNVVAINTLGTYLNSLLQIQRGTPVSSTPATTSVSTLYTVSSNVQFLLKDIDICNTTGSPATFNIYLVPSGSTASQSNALFYNAPISGYTTVQWSGELALAAGSTIQALASATTVSIKISGGAS